MLIASLSKSVYPMAAVDQCVRSIEWSCSVALKGFWLRGGLYRCHWEKTTPTTGAGISLLPSKADSALELSEMRFKRHIN